MINQALNFADAIRASGLTPPDFIVHGKMHRFPGVGKRKSNRAAWCLLFEDGMGGSFGDWSSGLNEIWQADRNKSYSQSERYEFMRRINEVRKCEDEKRKDKQILAAKRTVEKWNASTCLKADHSYLVRKGIKPFNARQEGNCIVLPITDVTGKLTSLQYISGDGDKKLLFGGRKQGCFINVNGDLENPCEIILCEGWATGCTLADESPASLVLAAIDAGNLKPVAMAVSLQWPTVKLIIASDDDQLTAANPGLTKAREAAVVSGALLAIPQWPADAPKSLSDFNDLSQWVKGAYCG